MYSFLYQPIVWFCYRLFWTRSRLLAEWVHCQHSKKAWLNFLDILEVVTLWPKGLRPFGIPGRSAGGRPIGQVVSKICRGQYETVPNKMKARYRLPWAPMAKHIFPWALNIYFMKIKDNCDSCYMATPYIEIIKLIILNLIWLIWGIGISLQMW